MLTASTASVASSASESMTTLVLFGIVGLIVLIEIASRVGLFDCIRLNGHCNATFSGNWNKPLASRDPATLKSRSGWIIFYAECPIIWASKLQSQVVLSTTLAKYIALSMSLQDVLPIMFLIKEMRERGFQVIRTAPQAYDCKVFEDNSGALELAHLPKLCPCTKHINVCYHHFREHVRS